MANEIASFFEASSDAAAVHEGVAGHLRRFWDPRMRRELVAWIDEHGGESLRPVVIAAVAAHRDTLLAPASSKN
jgi:formate dehydrogenase subunit delta